MGFTIPTLPEKLSKTQTFVTILMLIFCGVFLANIAPIFNVWQKNNLEREMTHIESLEQQVKDCAELRNRISQIEVQLALTQATKRDAPFPEWLTSVNGEILHINDAYELMLLRPRNLNKEDYRRSRDSLIQDVSLSAIHKEDNNFVILSTGNTIVSIVDVPNSDGEIEQWLVTNYPWRFGDDIIGVFGSCQKIPI